MRKILEQSFPFASAKSESIYRLVEEEGTQFIEKVTTSISQVAEVPQDADAAKVFRDFVSEKLNNRERNKTRISTRDAFIWHNVHDMSWQKIADEIGQKSGASIATRVAEFTRDMAHRYSYGANIHQLGADLDMSANHLHEILVAALERERDRLLWDYKSGGVMRTFGGDVSRVVSITNFLNDWDSFEYQVVSPFEEEDVEITPGKKILYSEEFYSIHKESGKRYRVSGHLMEGLSGQSWSSTELSEVLGIVSTDPIVAVYDMFGNLSKFYTDSLQTAAGEGS